MRSRQSGPHLIVQINRRFRLAACPPGLQKSAHHLQIARKLLATDVVARAGDVTTCSCGMSAHISSAISAVTMPPSSGSEWISSAGQTICGASTSQSTVSLAGRLSTLGLKRFLESADGPARPLTRQANRCGSGRSARHGWWWHSRRSGRERAPASPRRAGTARWCPRPRSGWRPASADRRRPGPGQWPAHRVAQHGRPLQAQRGDGCGQVRRQIEGP